MNSQNFESEILACSHFEKPGDDDKFLELVNSMEGKVDQKIASVLLRTFSDADDYGMQERTRKVLQSSDKAEYYPALIAELPYLVQRSPEKEWALTLVGMEFEYGDPDQLVRIASKAPEEQREFFFSFVFLEEFVDEYPSVQPFLQN